MDSTHSLKSYESEYADYAEPKETKSRRSRSFGGVLERRMTDSVTNETVIQYLLVKGRVTGIWSFPKGHSKRTETPYECAVREIREETGLVITYQPRRAMRMKGGIYFLFDISSETGGQEKPEDENEIEELRWVTREEMEYMIVNSGVKSFLHKTSS